MKETVSIHCDGSHMPGTSLGGWGAVIRWRDRRWEVGGFIRANSATNAEYLAMNKALRAIPAGHPVIVFSDALGMVTKNKRRLAHAGIRLIWQTDTGHPDHQTAHCIAKAFMTEERDAR